MIENFYANPTFMTRSRQLYTRDMCNLSREITAVRPLDRSTANLLDAKPNHRTRANGSTPVVPEERLLRDAIVLPIG